MGFSAHRAGICTVAAVGEVITSRTARTFSSFLKVVLWVVLVNGIAAVVFPEQVRVYSATAISFSVIGGGLLFGIGAAINGGCSFATISKIAQGELHVALTLPAFVLGALSANIVPPLSNVTFGNFAIDFDNIPVYIIIALALWGLFELVKILRVAIQIGPVTALNSKRYRLSSSAALIGLCSGLLYLFHGRWAYSSRVLDQLADPAAPPFIGSDSFVLFIALLTGAVASALSNRDFKFSFAGSKWWRNLTGGYLMGFGALLVPGGNGKLILHDLPHLALHAGVAYVAMIVGIALVLIVQMRWFGHVEIVSCAGDECKVIKP